MDLGERAWADFMWLRTASNGSLVNTVVDLRVSIRRRKNPD
jgi:hypothetical protein